MRAAAAHSLEGGVEDGVEVLHGERAGHYLLVEQLREGVHVELEPVLLVLHAKLLFVAVGWFQGGVRVAAAVFWFVWTCVHMQNAYPRTHIHTPTCAVIDTLKDLPRRIPRTSGSPSFSFSTNSFFPSPRARLMVRPCCSVALGSAGMGPASSSSSRWSFSSVASPRAPVGCWGSDRGTS